MQDGTNAILKMEEGYSTKTPVLTYKPHDITYRTWQVWSSLTKFTAFIQTQNDPADKTTPLHNLQFYRKRLYRMCVTMWQHRPPPHPHFSNDELGKILVFYSQKYGKSDQLQTILTTSICNIGTGRYSDYATCWTTDKARFKSKKWQVISLFSKASRQTLVTFLQPCRWQ